MLYFPCKLLDEATGAEPSARVFWEEVCCRLCGGQRARPLIEAPDLQAESGLWFAVVQCESCGLCYTNPRPAEGSLPQFYPEDYECHRPTLTPGRNPVRKRFLPTLRRWRPPFAWHGEGRLLDFGCGAGLFLARMKEYCWQVTGVDDSANAVRCARATTGAPILLGTLPHPELESNSFDVVTMWQALEHVPDPKQVLLEARKLLTWNGKLVIGVPNLDSLAFRLFGRHWCGLDLPRHLTHFTPWTLQLLLERSGYRVESVLLQRQSSWLRRSAHNACKNLQVGKFKRWLRTRAISRVAAAYAQITSQSDAMIATATPV